MPAHLPRCTRSVELSVVRRVEQRALLLTVQQSSVSMAASAPMAISQMAMSVSRGNTATAVDLKMEMNIQLVLCTTLDVKNGRQEFTKKRILILL